MGLEGIRLGSTGMDMIFCFIRSFDRVCLSVCLSVYKRGIGVLACMGWHLVLIDISDLYTRVELHLIPRGK